MHRKVLAGGLMLCLLTTACGNSTAKSPVTTTSASKVGATAPSSAAAPTTSASTTTTSPAPAATTTTTPPVTAPSSTVPEKKVLPDVRGKTVGVAHTDLTKVGVQKIIDDPVEKYGDAGFVLDQRPASNEPVEETVTLKVSAALPAMPDSKGKNVNEVKSWLERRDVKVEIENQLSDATAEDNILATIPATGEKIPKTVKLIIAKKPSTLALTAANVVTQVCTYTAAGDTTRSNAWSAKEASVDGRIYSSALSAVFGEGDTRAEAYCRAEYDLGRRWDTFALDLGVSDSTPSSRNAHVEIFVKEGADYEKVFGQDVVLGVPIRDIKINVTNKLRMLVIVRTLSPGYATFVLGNPRLIGPVSGGGTTTTAPATTTTTAVKA